jgi:protein arginine kinase
MIEKIVSRPQSFWTSNDGPFQHIVISSRIRLARNLEKMTMPAFQNETQGNAVLERVSMAAQQQDITGQGFRFYRLKELPPLERQILLEKHLISPEHAEENPNRGLLINQDESVSIMVNEEDHLRIQVLFPGLQLEKALEKADLIDNLLENKINYAFHERLGYLTACPTNVGTGLRASVMIHLPALSITKQAPHIFGTLSQLGLAVRGLYGEGSEATGNLFQISNQITLGQKEGEIVQNLTTVTRQIVEKEEEFRQLLLKDFPLATKDRVGRALGILRYASILNSHEALNLLSDLRLGLDLGLLNIDLGNQQLTELMIMTQPGFLQKYGEKPMEAAERDAVRAKLFRERLQSGGVL